MANHMLVDVGDGELYVFDKTSRLYPGDRVVGWGHLHRPLAGSSVRIFEAVVEGKKKSFEVDTCNFSAREL